jgi:hypothetical protein
VVKKKKKAALKGTTAPAPTPIPEGPKVEHVTVHLPPYLACYLLTVMKIMNKSSTEALNTGVGNPMEMAVVMNYTTQIAFLLEAQGIKEAETPCPPQQPPQ